MLNAIEKKAVFRSEKHKKKQERSRVRLLILSVLLYH